MQKMKIAKYRKESINALPQKMTAVSYHPNHNCVMTLQFAEKVELDLIVLLQADCFDCPHSVALNVVFTDKASDILSKKHCIKFLKQCIKTIKYFYHEIE